MGKRSKKYTEASQLVDHSRAYSPADAIDLVKRVAYTRFDSTVEVHMRLGVDPRQADQQVRGVVLYPHGTGNVVRVLVFAEGEAARIAEEAGADFVGGDDLVQKIQGGWLDFDVAIAIPQIMGKAGRLGRVLGPRGLMPSPKAGTVVQQEDLPRVIQEAHQGRVEFRLDRTANLHVPIGKASFSNEQLFENFATLMDAINKARPASTKGNYIRKVVMAPTMGPGIKLDLAQTVTLQPA